MESSGDARAVSAVQHGVIPVAWLLSTQGCVRGGREGGLDAITLGMVENEAGNAVSHSMRGEGGWTVQPLVRAPAKGAWKCKQTVLLRVSLGVPAGMGRELCQAGEA